MMDVETARALVEHIIYKPGWKFTTEPHTRRYQDAFKLRIDYPAQNSDRDQAPHFPEAIEPYAEFVIVVGQTCGEKELWKQILTAVMEVEEHEAREFFRIAPTYHAPFHPHHMSGTMAWGTTPEKDLLFGVA